MEIHTGFTLAFFHFLEYYGFMKDQDNGESKSKVWETVYKKIRSDINEYQYKPGEILSEVKIAQEMRISRTPVTMALNVLEQEGLVINNLGKKTVFRLSADELIQIFDVKISLQCTIVKLAASRKTKDQEKDFRKILKEIEQFLHSDFKSNGVNTQLTNQWLDYDLKYHNLISDMSQSPLIKKVVDDCDIKWHRMRSGVIALGDSTRKNAEEHMALGQLILDGDSDKAAELMKNHLENLLQTVLHLMGTFLA